MSEEVKKRRRERIAQALESAAKMVRDGAELDWLTTTVDGMDIHPRVDEAVEHAEFYLELPSYGDEWPEGTEYTKWGVFIPIQTTKMTNRVETPEGPCGYTCSFELRDKVWG